MNLKAMITSINSYIEIHEKSALTEEQKNAIIETRETMLKSLEFLQENPNDKKKEKKLAKKLDDVFNKMISVFANADEKICNPEIIETVANKSKKKSNPKEKGKSKSEKSKSEKQKAKQPTRAQKEINDVLKSKKLKNKSIDQIDQHDLLRILSKITDKMEDLDKKIAVNQIGITMAMTALDEFKSRIIKLEKEIEKLKRK